MAEGSDEPKRTWWIYIDLTVVFVVGAVALGALLAFLHFRSARQAEVEAMEMDRERSDARQKEQLAKADEYAKQRQAQADAKQKEKAAAIAAAEERRVREQAQRQAEREAAAEELAKKARERLEAEKQAAVETTRRAEEANKRAAAEAKKAEEERIAAEAKAKAEADAKLREEREREAGGLRATVADASKEAADLTVKIDALQPKIADAREKLDTAAKMSKYLPRRLREIDAEVSERPARTGKNAPSDPLERVLRDVAHDSRLPNEHADLLVAYLTGLREKRALLQDLAAATRKRDGAVAKLKELGIEVVVEPLAPPAAPKPPAAPAASITPKKTFLLKDGRKVVAATAIDGGDVWSIKTDKGKIEAVPKSAVEKIQEEDD